MNLKQSLLSEGYKILDGSSFIDVICADSIEFDWLPNNLEEKLPVGNINGLKQQLNKYRKMKLKHERIVR